MLVEPAAPAIKNGKRVLLAKYHVPKDGKKRCGLARSVRGAASYYQTKKEDK